MACPQGTLQLLTGSASCRNCPAGFDLLPAPLPVAQTHLTARACAPFATMIALVWTSGVNPATLLAQVFVADLLPSWLSVDVSGSTLISVQSSQIPPPSSVSSPVNFSVSVSQNCRSQPWTATVSVDVQGADPSFLVGQSPSATVFACPDFALTIGFQFGSCPALVAVTALLANLSSLPPFVAVTVGGGVLQLTGTLPAGVDNLSVIGVITNGNTTIYSTVANISRSVDSLPVFTAPSSASVNACPRAVIPFSLVPGKCGLTSLSAELSDGTALPSFLTAVADHTTIVMSGDVPELYPTFSIVAVAMTISNLSIVSPAVQVVRPVINGSVNLSVTLANSEGLTQQQSVSGGVTMLSAVAAFGVTITVTIAVDAGAKQRCSAVPLLYNDAPPPPHSQPSASSTSHGTFGVPSWMVVTTSQSKIEFSGTPSKFTAALSESPFVFFVWANDGAAFPTVCVNLTLQQSLIIHSTLGNSTNITTSAGSGLGIFLSTPSPLVSLNMQLPADLLGGVTLVCPAQGVITAFCSFDLTTGSLGAFGTTDGINALLQSLSIALTAGTNIVLGTADMLASDSLNPFPLSAAVQLGRFRQYSGLQQLQAVTLRATVGKPLSVNLNPYFTSPSGVTFSLAGSDVVGAWLSVQSGFLLGTPPSPAQVLLFHVQATEKFTSITVNATLNVSWPLPPIPQQAVAFRQQAQTSTLLDIRLPQTIFSDPENGTLTFSAGLDRGTSPLPAFMTFDSAALRLSGTAAPGDVGSYSIIITAISRWGDWEGNATTIVIVSVVMSWEDFFAYVYTMIGYGLSGLTAVASALVYRALLRNILLPTVYRRRTLPAEFISGRYTLRSPSSEEPIPSSDIASATVTRLSTGPEDSAVLPWYVLMQRRKQDGEYLDPEAKATGASWITFKTHRDKSVILVVDMKQLEALVASGEVLPSDEYILEVTSSGWWCSGFLIEAATFSPSCFLSDGEIELQTLKLPHQEVEGVDLHPPGGIARAPPSAAEDYHDIVRREISQLKQDLELRLFIQAQHPQAAAKQQNQTGGDMTNAVDPASDPTAVQQDFLDELLRSDSGELSEKPEDGGLHSEMQTVKAGMRWMQTQINTLQLQMNGREPPKVVDPYASFVHQSVI